MPSMLHDLLAPSALSFQSHSLDLGDTRAKVLVVTGFPPRVGPAWLARLAQMPGVVLSVHVVPAEPGALVTAVNRSVTEFASRLASGGPPIAQQRNQQSLDDAKELLRKIDAEHQAVGQVVVTLLVIAPDQEELARRVRAVQAACAAASMRAYEASYRQEDGLRGAGPWAHLPAGVAKMGQRHMPMETVAAMYPFVRSGLNEGSGIVWGRDADAGVVLLDRWAQTNGRINGNVNILGGSGGGKSTASKVLLLREYVRGARVLIVDPEGEYGPLAKSLGGIVIDTAGGHGRINPLHVSPEPDEDDDANASHNPGTSVSGPLATHIQRLKSFFDLYLPCLEDLERAVLEKATVAAYRAAGVDWATDPAGVQTWPTVADVYHQLQQRDDAKRLVVLLESAAEGADSALWAGQSTVQVGHADFVVLDIHRLQRAAPNVRRAQYFNVLSLAWDLVREGRATGKYTVLVVDEAWVMIDPAAPQALQHLYEWSKRIRKYGPNPIGSSLVIVTQNINDFLAPEVERLGAPVIDNASIKLLTRQEGRDLEGLSTLLRLTEAEHSLLSNAKRGAGLLLAGNDRVRLNIEVAPWEAELIGMR